MKQTVAAYIAKTLESAGVKRIWGVTGDSLNGLSDSLNRMGTIEWMSTRHEEVAAFAAGAEAQLSGELAVCAGSCGPGNLHLINGLFDCHRNHVPVLAIAAHIPSSEIGSGYFQETHPQELFRECSHYCELVSSPEQIPQVLAIAMRKAVLNRGVSVVVLPGDVALKPAPEGATSHWYHAPQPVVTPEEEELRKLAQLLRYSSNIALMCGSGCAGAHKELVEFAGKIKAPIVHALRGKEHVEYDNPYDVGMTGLIGFSSGFHTMMNADTLVLLGTQFPYRAFYPTDAKIIQIDIDPAEVNKNILIDTAIIGDVKAVLTILNRRLSQQHHEAWMQEIQDMKAKYPMTYHQERLSGPGLIEKIYELTEGDAIITTEVGQHQMWAAQYYKFKEPRQLLTSGGLGTMGYGVGACIGAKYGRPDRVAINIAGDGCFRMNMNEIATASRYNVPIIQVVINNHVLGMVRQWQTLFYDKRYSNTILDDSVDFVKVADALGATGFRATNLQEFEDAMKQAIELNKPVVIDCIIGKDDKVWPMVAAGAALETCFDQQDLDNK